MLLFCSSVQIHSLNKIQHIKHKMHSFILLGLISLFVNLLLIDVSGAVESEPGPSGSNSSSDDLSRFWHLYEQLFALYEPAPPMDVTEIQSQLTEALNTIQLVPQNDNVVAMIEKLEDIETMNLAPRCNVRQLQMREQTRRRFSNYPRLDRLITHLNDKFYAICAERLDDQIQEYIEYFPHLEQHIVTLVNYVKNEIPQEQRTSMLQSITFKQLAHATMNYSGEIHGFDWNKPPHEDIQFHVARFNTYFNNEFAIKCMECGAVLATIADTFRWLHAHIENLEPRMSSTSLLWMDYSRVCNRMMELQRYEDILLETKYDFFELSSVLFLPEGEPIMALHQTEDIIDQLDHLIEFRNRLYDEDHTDMNILVKSFKRILRPHSTLCTFDFLDAINGFLGKYGNYVNLGPVLKQAATEQQLICSTLIRRSINAMRLSMSEWDNTQITNLRTMIEVVEPDITQQAYYDSISWNRFMTGFNNYLTTWSSEEELRNVTPSEDFIHLSIEHIGSPCQRLINQLELVYEVFEQVILLDENYVNNFAPIELDWMKNTKICLQMLKSDLPGNLANLP